MQLTLHAAIQLIRKSLLKYLMNGGDLRSFTVEEGDSGETARIAFTEWWRLGREVVDWEITIRRTETRAEQEKVSA